MFTYKIIKKGRKWYEGTVPESGYKAKIEINDLSKGWKVGETVQFEGRMKIQESYGFKKYFLFPCTKEDREKEIEDKKIEKWLKYVEKTTTHIYKRGVEELGGFELNESQKNRLEKAIEVATKNKCMEKINDHFYYLRTSASKGKWYEKGEDKIKENLKKIKEFGIDIKEYEDKLEKIRTDPGSVLKDKE